MDWRAFLRTLDELHFQGNLAIEREAGEQRAADIRAAREFLEGNMAAVSRCTRVRERNGSIQQTSSAGFRQNLQPFFDPTTNWPAGHVPSSPSIRVLFP